eukprot:scaffold526379_cov18-Prasinocladus_malaysianus.AAC.1
MRYVFETFNVGGTVAPSVVDSNDALEKRKRGSSWCDVLASDNRKVFLSLRCKSCSQIVTGYKSILGAGRAHWPPDRDAGLACRATQHSSRHVAATSACSWFCRLFCNCRPSSGAVVAPAVGGFPAPHHLHRLQYLNLTTLPSAADAINVILAGALCRDGST